MTTTGKKLIVMLACAMLVCILALAACSGNAGSSISSSTNASDASSSAASNPGASSSAADASDESQSSEPFGKPWITSQVSGNLPARIPDVKDDLYSHYNYDYISEHQGQDVIYMGSTEGEVREATIAALKDESRTDREIEQMRIFFNQAADQEALKAIGFSEVQPYIDMIDKVSSIDEMNALLASDDFPFTPFVSANLGVTNTRGVTAVSVLPNFVICDAFKLGATYYQESDDPERQQQNDMVLFMMALKSLVDVNLIVDSDGDLTDLLQKIVDFEKEYGKYADYTAKYLSADYGAFSKAVKESVFTLDELCALCPNIPMKAMLAKCKKDGASEYSAASPEWMGALNDLWTEDNLETIKLIAKCKVLDETRPYRDQSATNELIDGAGVSAPDSETAAYNACNNINTFAQVIAKEYVNDALGEEGKTRLRTLTANLITTYKKLLADTAWISAESEELITEKLDHMTLNVLEPVSGYFDYSALELAPTEAGGTLLSNYLKLKQYRYDREAERIGQPATADTVWFTVKPTEVNAFYDPQTNSISIMPGFVTSCVYTNDMDDTDVLAGIGWVIGHEISHGFDYLGSQLGAYGQPEKVFSDDDLKVFLAKCMDLADYYSTIEYLPGQFVDGQNVVGEGAADLCGMQACLVLADKAGNTDYDQFFKRAALDWAQATSSETMLQILATDTHPLNNLRANVNAQMLKPIYEKLGVSEGDVMYLAPDKRIAFWGEDA